MYKYQSARIELEAELKQLLTERGNLMEALARVNKRIKAINRASDALGDVVRQDNEIPTSLGAETKFEVTESIREVLKSNVRRTRDDWFLEPLSAPQIKEKLEMKGWQSQQHPNPLAIVHTVLVRLIKAGQVEKKHVAGRLVYTAILNQVERDAITAEQKQREEEQTRKYWNEREEKEALQRLRKNALGAIIKVSREELSKRAQGISMENIGTTLAERQIDVSSYNSLETAIAQAFKTLGVRKDKSTGLWNFPKKERAD